MSISKYFTLWPDVVEIIEREYTGHDIWPSLYMIHDVRTGIFKSIEAECIEYF